MLEEHIERYLHDLSLAMHALDRPAVSALTEALMKAWRERRQVFLMGNGGSAALASHMASDLSKITAPGLPRWRAISLTDTAPLVTAWANDVSYECIFAEQLRNLCQPDDLVIAISCSGESTNVIEGVGAARELGATVAALTGDRGGRLAETADLCVRAPAAFIGQQEDIHMVLDHLVTSALRAWVKEIAVRLARPPRALILAAGEGSRLRPLTVDRPKPMVPICGRPLLEHTIRWLVGHGIREIAINLHHRPEAIVEHFGTGEAFGAELSYSYEERLLGTAGAVRKLADFLESGPFVVVYGDVLTDFDLGALLAYHHERAIRDPRSAATASLYRVSNVTEVGLVGLDGNGRIERFVEKPKAEEVFTDLANAGILVAEPEIIGRIPPDAASDFGRNVLPQLIEEGASVYGWKIPESAYLMDIGTPEKYKQAQEEWGRRGR